MKHQLKDNPQHVLEKVFGYSAFRGQQLDIINNVLQGHDAVVLMPTGGGKSLCYQIPAICATGLMVVVSPLISLMQDQVVGLTSLGVNAAFINSTLPYAEILRIMSDVKENKIDILYVSPERLFISDFQDFLHTVSVAFFAIDEAHCISVWGHDFRPEYTQLSVLKKSFPNANIIALTATADLITRNDMIKNLALENAKVFISSFDRPNIEYMVAIKDKEKNQLIDFINTYYPDESGIVYCLSRARVEKIAAFLAEKGKKALPYHAGLTSAVRAKHQKIFTNEENVIMVATIAFGMGIDKSNVRFVVHLDLPKSVEAYYQETGRAGRDGLPSRALMIYGLSDIVNQHRFILASGINDAQKQIERHKLNAIVDYAQTVKCRRAFLLNYFDEQRDDTCNNCDNCKSDIETYDASVDCQKFLSCVYRASSGSLYSFGVGHIINILLGKNDEKIKKFNHTSLSTYGIGKETSMPLWRAIVRHLVINNLIEIDNTYQTVNITTAGFSFLKEKTPVLLRKNVGQSAKIRPEKQKTSGVLDNQQDKDLFDKLKKLRLSIAQEKKLPPYVIFYDRALIDMVKIRPQTLEDMAKINGVGEVKLKTYAPQFLDIILQG